MTLVVGFPSREKKDIFQLLYDPAYSFDQRLNILKMLISDDSSFREILQILLEDFASRNFSQYFVPEEAKHNGDKRISEIFLSKSVNNLFKFIYMPLYHCLMDVKNRKETNNDLISSIKDKRQTYFEIETDEDNKIPLFENEGIKKYYQCLMRDHQEKLMYGKVLMKKRCSSTGYHKKQLINQGHLKPRHPSPEWKTPRRRRIHRRSYFMC